MMYVRELKPGMSIWIDDARATVAGVQWMDGDGGRPKTLIGGGALNTALAVEITFMDGSKTTAHPGATVSCCD